MTTRRIFSLRALTTAIGAGLFSGVQRAWAQCYYVFFNCFDFCENNCWNCGQTSFSAWADSIIAPTWGGYCFYCLTGCTNPHHMCNLWSVLIMERCGSGPYTQRFAYPCCTECGWVGSC